MTIDMESPLHDAFQVSNLKFDFLNKGGTVGTRHSKCKKNHTNMMAGGQVLPQKLHKLWQNKHSIKQHELLYNCNYNCIQL